MNLTLLNEYEMRSYTRIFPSSQCSLDENSLTNKAECKRQILRETEKQGWTPDSMMSVLDVFSDSPIGRQPGCVKLEMTAPLYKSDFSLI